MNGTIGAFKRSPRDGPENLLRRDGHLSALSLERRNLGELSAQASGVFDSHVESCDSCRADYTEVCRDLGVDPRELMRLPPVRSRSVWRRTWGWSGGLAVAAAAAMMMLPRGDELAVGSPLDGAVATAALEVEDQLRRKGDAFEFEVHVHDGDQSRLAGRGERVSAGDRVGFRMFPRFDGHVMIVGSDATGASYLCYPQHNDGRSTPVRALDQPWAVDEAVELDETPGTERIVALLCPDAFTFDEVAAALREIGEVGTNDLLPPIVDACIQRELVLVKGDGGMAP